MKKSCIRRKAKQSVLLGDMMEEWRLTFLEHMKNFPCTFNLGNANIDVDGSSTRPSKISEPVMCKNKWKYLLENLKDDEDDQFENPVWKENLLTRAYYETGYVSSAKRLNQEIVNKSGNQNLVALGNAAFLHFQDHEREEANATIQRLRKLKADQTFNDLKIDALCEQAFAYRKFGGAANLLSALSLLAVALPFRPHDERLQFMKAMVYRRCTHFNIYSEDPENIDQHEFALEAATSLYRLGSNAINKNIKAAALIELAYLKYNDDMIAQHNWKIEKPVLDRRSWDMIVGSADWSSLCERALRTGGDNPPEKVLKIAGQLFRYSRNHRDLETSARLLIRAIEQKPTNRAYHHLGLTYRKMAGFWEKNNVAPYPYVQRQVSNSMRRQISELQTLPEPPVDKRPQSLGERLKIIAKVPRERLQQYSKRNEYARLAVKQFEQSVKISYKQNRLALYDLAMTLAQMGRYDESIKWCQTLIHESDFKGRGVQEPLMSVSAFNLHGMCLAMKAEEEVDEEARALLLDESEYILTCAVRVASQLAADIPELATCATDLWNAFDKLELKFIFNGDKSSKDKLFKICELIADYRYLQVFDDIVSKDESNWENEEAIENCLKSYINLGDYDGAMVFLDMIPLKTASKYKMTWSNSETTQKLMLEHAKRTLTSSPLPSDDGELKIRRDPVWRQIVHEKYNAESESKTYDVVILNDPTDDWSPIPGTRSDNAAKALKEVLERRCGLKAALAHEEGLTVGGSYLAQQGDIMSDSPVVIFVVDKPPRPEDILKSTKAQSNDQGLSPEGNNKAHRVNQRDSVWTGSESSAGEEETVHHDADFGEATREHTESGTESMSRSIQEKEEEDEEEKDEFMSNTFQHFLDSCVNCFVVDKSPHIVLMLVGELKTQDLPPSLRSLTSLQLSDDHIHILSLASQGDISDRSRDLVIDVFGAIVNTK